MSYCRKTGNRKPFNCLCFQAEQSIAELSSSEHSLKAEVADLRAAAAKLSALNEALALDKVGLNQQLLQVSKDFSDPQGGAGP